MQEENFPNHIAIIPDGNRRWAQEHGLKPWEGHEAGAENMEKITKRALKLGIFALSFWGSSLYNLAKRPLLEKKALLDIYERYFEKLIADEDTWKNEVKINVIGRWREQMPQRLIELFESGMEKTQHHKKHLINFFIAYNGDDEMVEAVKNIVRSGKSAENINAEEIKRNLMTKDLPPVDFLVRTGEEPHNSAGFMMWDTANSQLYFSEKMFPDFNEDEFEKTVEEYKRRERRLGK